MENCLPNLTSFKLNEGVFSEIMNKHVQFCFGIALFCMAAKLKLVINVW